MRITNGMLINNSLSNINNNKRTLDRLNTQLASKKVIQRPSDDPIVAIRALRFRSTLSEIDQYLKKNITDARSWMESTEEALEGIVDKIGDITEYCNQAVNGYYDAQNKNSIVETLKGYRDAIYNNANADCAGKTIFTGYKTNEMLTFVKEPEKKYKITQHFNSDSVDSVTKVVNELDVKDINDATIGATNVSSIKLPTQSKVYRVRLAYENLSSADGIAIELKNPDTTVTAVTKSSKDSDAYLPGDDEVYYLADTGEVIIGKNAYADFMAAESFDITYTKDSFVKGDLDPIQYFDCVDITDADSSKWVTYTNRNQEINYEINFNQTIAINIQGKNVFTPDMVRDLDEIINAVNFAISASNKVEKIKALYDNAEIGSADKETYKKILDLCQREKDFADENMKNAFSMGLDVYTKHEVRVSLARADIGTRLNRLDLNESRLKAQRITVENLKSTNEDANVVEVGIELEEAESIYDASLMAAAKVVQKKLLDFL
ncbi:MAG: hypothetical protein K2N34_11590 [Lachnospiraceae bacterium]|nr:hypothetical protein [Lachnospiraceae bacterium]